MEIRNPPSLSRNPEGEIYIYQIFSRKEVSNYLLKESLIYQIICFASNLDSTFGNNLSLSFPTFLGKFSKEVSEFYPQISTELNREEIVRFAQDCNRARNYANLKQQLEILKKGQPLTKHYHEIYLLGQDKMKNL